MQNAVDFTCTAFVTNKERTKVAMQYHKKFSRWMPAGGHIDPGELPHEAAIREAKEELGLDCKLDKMFHKVDTLLENNPDIQPNTIAMYKQDIPEYKGTPAHVHCDHWFILTADESQPFGGEENQSTWLTKKELFQLGEDETFQSVKDMANVVLVD